MGILKVLKKAGNITLDGIDVPGDVLAHPAVMPLSMMLPCGWARTALLIVRKVTLIADEIQGETGYQMTDEQKRKGFAKLFREKFPKPATEFSPRLPVSC